MSIKKILYLEVGEGYKLFESFEKLESYFNGNDYQNYIKENFSNESYIIIIDNKKSKYILKQDSPTLKEDLIENSNSTIKLKLPLEEAIEIYKVESGVKLTEREKERAVRRYFNRTRGIEDPNIKIIKQDKRKEKQIKINL